MTKEECRQWIDGEAGRQFELAKHLAYEMVTHEGDLRQRAADAFLRTDGKREGLLLALDYLRNLSEPNAEGQHHE